MRPGIDLRLLRVSTSLWLAQIVRNGVVRTATAETRGEALRLLLGVAS